VMVLAVGALHLPLIPRVPGLETFRGESFHSARWNHRFDFKNKRVAVIGTGASAIQFVPQIAPLVAKLSLYQRTPPWVVPKGDREISDRTRTLLGLFPGLRLLRRGAIFAVQELRHLAMRRNPKVAGLARMMASKHRARAIPDLDLQERLTPSYEIGCKRILRSDDYYPALARPNVEIVDGGIDRITETGIVGADGVERPADAILFGTGFHVTDGYDALTVIGRDGLALRDAWAERGMSAAFGTAVAGFPNMFMLLGPNTGLGHNSVVLMVEAQVGYVMRRLSQMRIRRLRSIEIAPEVQRAYADEMQTRLASTVWQAGGCMSWYQDAQGRNTTLWPGTVIEYRRRMKRATLQDYAIEKATETV
jgi:cation diffusion facilitator CzcD-associated flavoprotein CzcO